MSTVRAIAIAALAAAVGGTACAGAGGAESSGRGRVVLAAGDIARCDRRNDERAAAIVQSYPGAVVLTLGDNVYPAGNRETYRRCYAPSWGRFRKRTKPTPGNHDLTQPGADGGRTYRSYFGVPDWYAFDVGTWRVYSLNSEGPIATQAAWLDRDLRTNPRRCVLAYWHAPLFSAGPHHGSAKVKPLWEVLYRHRADVVLSGHNHNYQRFAPQNPDGREVARGIRQFVVGTGGAGLEEIDPDRRTTTNDVSTRSAYGVLRLVLGDGAYEWRFLPVGTRTIVNRWTGKRFEERGRSECV